jgi:hypothetical protein
MSVGSIKWRLFLTAWLVYVVHFATDFVREHYLVLSIVDDHAFRLDPYADLHVDIFWNPDSATVKGAHHGANPGVSMLAAVPYFPVQARGGPGRQPEPGRPQGRARYVDRHLQRSRWRRVEFYKKVWSRGLDIRFGLIGAITPGVLPGPDQRAQRGGDVRPAYRGGVAPGSILSGSPCSTPSAPRSSSAPDT